ncbi:MAG TPA: hypothetical protein VK177_10275 [Flavobacteriales bacterium]|nr:hypothetical protein [Flavobacteriales bacterium]
MKLLVSQKDEIYKIIEDSGFSPLQFNLEEDPGDFLRDAYSRLSLKNSDYYYDFFNRSNDSFSHYSVFCPGRSIYSEKAEVQTWEGHLRCLKEWFKNLRREIKAENKWDRLNQEIQEVAVNFEDNNSHKFTAHEYKQLTIKIDSLKLAIANINLLPDHLEVINNKLDHLTELAEDLNKFDWKNLFIGTIISVIIQLGVTQENAKSIWDCIKIIFSNYFLN